MSVIYFGMLPGSRSMFDGHRYTPLRRQDSLLDSDETASTLADCAVLSSFLFRAPASDGACGLVICECLGPWIIALATGSKQLAPGLRTAHW